MPSRPARIRADPVGPGHGGDHPARLLDFTWSKEATTLHLRQVLIDCGFFATICTLTATPRDLSYFDGPWRTLMAGMVFDRVEAPAPFPARPSR